MSGHRRKKNRKHPWNVTRVDRDGGCEKKTNGGATAEKLNPAHKIAEGKEIEHLPFRRGRSVKGSHHHAPLYFWI